MERSWRKPNPHQSMWAQRLNEFVPATQIFNQIYFIGNDYVCCYVIETTDGLIMIDALLPGEHYEQGIETGFEALGLDLSRLRAILLTHGHFDHYGCADYLRQKTNCKIYMSEIDYEHARTNYDNGPGGKLEWEVDEFISDGQVFTLGDMSIQCCLTPGHTDGCMSFIFPVTDEGVAHTAALWGGTGVPASLMGQISYLKSVLAFSRLTEERNVDVALSNHPFIDAAIARINVLRTMHDGVPNPFVLGASNYKYYEKLFLDMCIEKMEKYAEEDKK